MTSLSPSARRFCGGGLAIAAAGCALATAAHAQDAPNAPPSFVVGGVAALPEFEGSEDVQIVPLVAANFNAFGARVEVEGIQGVTVDLVRHPIWRAGPAFGAALPRNDDATNDTIALLPEVGFSAEVGGFVGFETPVAGLPEGRVSGDVSVRQDVAGGHEGLVVRTDLDYFFAVNRVLRFSVGANATYADQNYYDSFFTVTPEASVASGLAAFEAESGLKDVGAEGVMILSFHPRYAVFFRGAYNRLLADAADSPIVDVAGDPNQIFLGGGLFYSF